MALSLEQLSSQLTEAGLLSTQDLIAFLDEHKPADAEQLLKQLARHKRLTAWQAQQIYAGKAKTLVLGNYVLVDKLGQGGMGMVLKAQHRRMKRLVALKVLSPVVAKSPDSLARFHREVEAAAKLTHPNIVAAFDADESNGTSFLVMEFVDGKDLASVVKMQGPLSMAQATKCILQAAKGLEYAHHQRIVHRDIKPANLLIDHQGTVKILDMGLARIDTDGAKNELTSTGAVMGTVDYMAPEQALSTKHADARSDVYSLGVSLWYLLTARAVYDGDSMMARLLGHRDAPIPSLAETLAKRTSGKPIPPQQAAAIDAVFRKMVAKKPEDRYQSMHEVIQALEAFQSGDVGVATLTATAAGAIESTTAGGSSVRVDPHAATAVSLPDDDHLVPGSPFAATLPSGHEESPTDPSPPSKATRKPAATSRSDSAIRLAHKAPPKSGTRSLIVGGGLAGAVLVVAIILGFSGRKPATKGARDETAKADITGTSVASESSPSMNVSHQPETAVAPKTEASKPPLSRSGITFDEPPALDQWLKGRSILKVARDGRGQFQTIQAALNVLKPGQAVEVLDRGPYQESLKLMRPPADTGIFSRVQTVLEIPAWEKHRSQGSSAESLNGHQLFDVRGFRISGFQIAGRNESLQTPQCVLYFEGSSGVVIEDCQIRFTEVPVDKTVSMSAIRLNGFSPDPLQSSVVRNCALDGALAVVAWPGVVAGPLAIMHNYVQPLNNSDAVNVSGPQRRVFIRENIIKTDETCRAFVLSVSRPGAELIEFVRNTVVGPGDNLIQSTVPAGEVVLQDNVGQAFRLAQGAESQKKETENWHISGNWYSIRPESTPYFDRRVFRRLSDPLADVRFLSENPAEPNFARLNPLSSGAIAGALPAGPVGSGDWFSTLQQRWSLFGTTASGTTTAQPAHVAATAVTYDMIPTLNLASDRISMANMTGKNDWTIKDTVLRYTSDGKSGKVMFPILMNDVRAFTIEGDVHRTSGSGVFSFAIPVSDSLMTSLDLIPGGNIQLGLVAGKRQTIGQWPRSEERAHLKIDVDELPSGPGTVVVHVNGKEAARWSGSIRTIGKSLEFHPDHPGQRLLGIFVFKDSFEFKNLKLTTRNGAARKL
jgi:serine/threonine protein kinase